MAHGTRPQTDKLRDLLAAVVEEMNALVPDDRELRRRWDAAQVLAASPRLSARDRQMIQDGVDLPQQRMMRGSAVAERADYAVLFRTLAAHGRLPKSALQELVEDASEGVRITWRVVGKQNDVGVIEEQTFKSPAARWAYAVLMLAQAGQVDFRVVACKHCGRLVLVKLGNRGRPRSEFCSPAHSVAFAQRTLRHKKASQIAAARHK